MKSEQMIYRLYTFVNNVYMSPVQWGIQTAHVVSTMMSDPKYTGRHDLFDQWALGSPTIIVCKGGTLSSLFVKSVDIARLAHQLDLPFATFNEDQESLGGILTCVGVLVPENIFASKFQLHPDIDCVSFRTINDRYIMEETDPVLFEFTKLITSAQLA